MYMYIINFRLYFDYFIGDVLGRGSNPFK